MPCKCVNSVDNFCYMSREITFASRKHALSLLLKRAYFLYFGCNLGDPDKSLALGMCCTSCPSKLNPWGESERTLQCLWYGGSQQILLLFGASYSEIDYQEENIDSGVPKYTIGYSCGASLWRSAYCRTPRQFFTRLWWGRGEYTWRNTTAINLKRSGIFLNITSVEPHKIIQKELFDLIRGLELSKNKTAVVFKMWTVESSGWHCERGSILFPRRKSLKKSS